MSQDTGHLRRVNVANPGLMDARLEGGQSGGSVCLEFRKGCGLSWSECHGSEGYKGDSEPARPLYSSSCWRKNKTRSQRHREKTPHPTRTPCCSLDWRLTPSPPSSRETPPMSPSIAIWSHKQQPLTRRCLAFLPRDCYPLKGAGPLELSITRGVFSWQSPLLTSPSRDCSSQGQVGPREPFITWGLCRVVRCLLRLLKIILLPYKSCLIGLGASSDGPLGLRTLCPSGRGGCSRARRYLFFCIFYCEIPVSS